MTEQKHPGGRPQLPLPDNACDEVIKLGMEGASLAEMAAHFDVCKQTLHSWQKRHPEFSVAVKKAIDLAQAWWEKQGRDGIWGGKKFSPATYCFVMKNRFKDDYRDNPHADDKKQDTVINVHISKDDAGL